MFENYCRKEKRIQLSRIFKAVYQTKYQRSGSRNVCCNGSDMNGSLLVTKNFEV